MDEQDVLHVLSYPVTLIGSESLPNDPMPNLRLWGAFLRVLGHYSRDKKLFPLITAIHKMTGLSTVCFNLSRRGLVREGYFALTIWYYLTRKLWRHVPPSLAAAARGGD